ncbi:DUF3179 domain-containing protein [Echinicola jeungdonensis]|uniref:DUF3179 domain-containing protein n=1 Tax=Echinicola jeungdonensis TaxID=709343 RepID=A0ABV5J2C4_9BACT|nr:DUF3179 domain-containing protein [Echinicola jeungdonensis]MDN3669038.1 DUF3179 domain-containing protein [Echinicola jeungdonensis]
MKNLKKIISSVWLVLMCSSGCTEGDSPNSIGGIGGTKQDTTWLIPIKEVFDGGPGKDGIPALTNPNFISASEAIYLSDEDLVLGYVDLNEAKAYPHRILDWHEIINDDINEISMAVIYCPLTGTGIAWDRNIGKGKTTFGVSGLLYNTNIIPYDRATDTNWSQILLKAVNGDLAGQNPKTINLVETSWKNWREMFPQTKVVSTITGHNRNYGFYPYGSYRTNETILFPVSKRDNRLHPKERVLGIIHENSVKAYRIEMFGEVNSLILDQFGTNDLVIVGNKTKNFIVAFNRKLPDGTLLDFEVVENKGATILKDQEGNQWDIMGRAVSGPREGERLKAMPQMIGYWFAWAPFYKVELFQ